MPISHNMGRYVLGIMYLYYSYSIMYVLDKMILATGWPAKPAMGRGKCHEHDILALCLRFTLL